MPSDIVDQALKDEAKTLQIIQMLRFKTHQSRYAKRLKVSSRTPGRTTFNGYCWNRMWRSGMSRQAPEDAGAEQRVHDGG